MHLKPKAHRYVQWLGATLAAILTTLGLAMTGARATTAGMVFLMVVVVTAAQAEIVISLYGSLLCAISFDYFFLPPVHTFTLRGPQEWVSMITFAVSSVVAGRVAERARTQKEQAEQRREDVERLYVLSQEMMLHEDTAALIRDLPSILAKIFALGGVVLYVQDRDEYVSTVHELPDLFKANLREMTSGAGVDLTAQDGFEARALMVGMRAVGAVAWTPSSLSREVATAVCAQLGIAITRAIAIESTARMEASREGDRLRAALIDSLTHELRTPLTSIRAAATTLTQDEGLDDAVRRELATVVDEESAHLDALIGEAVEMAELDAKVLRVQAAPHHARMLLEHALEGARRVLGHHQVTLMVQEPDTPVWFDAKLLSRVFGHLIENAAQYSPAESRIILRSRRVEGRLEFEVEDGGPGIDKVDLPHIFEKFYRGKKGAKQGKGTGMGLAIAHAMMVAHGGGIGVESNPEHGSIFRFWVPLEVRQEEELRR